MEGGGGRGGGQKQEGGGQEGGESRPGEALDAMPKPLQDLPSMASGSAGRKGEFGGFLTLGAGQNSATVGASRCDARTARRAVPTPETKNSVLRPLTFSIQWI